MEAVVDVKCVDVFFFEDFLHHSTFPDKNSGAMS